MTDKNIMVIVPFPFDEPGIEGRREQLDESAFGENVDFQYKPVKTSCALGDSWYDFKILGIGVFEAGLEAENEGFDAVCIDTVSDSALDPLRSRLDIPVIGPGQVQYHIASILGKTFSVITQWDKWMPLYEKTANKYGVTDKLASVHSIDVRPDVEMLLEDKKENVFPKLKAEALDAINNHGADVICMGSTTMHQSVDFLQDELPVPVMNPGLISYKLAELLIDLGLSHSKEAYPTPEVPMDEKLHAMLDSIEGKYREFDDA